MKNPLRNLSNSNKASDYKKPKKTYNLEFFRILKNLQVACSFLMVFSLIITLFFNFFIMPNWNSNRVTIKAPLEEVKKYLGTSEKRGETVFNMHKLFPDDFSSNNCSGLKEMDIGRYIRNTGTKWPAFIEDFFEIENKGDFGGKETVLNYRTAWVPNNPLLEKLHSVTGWEITNFYEEPGNYLRGVFTCEEGRCVDTPL